MKYMILVVLLTLSTTSNARWLDVSGNVTHLVTYAHNETILVTLDNTGNDVLECSNKVTFAISKTMSPEGRSRMYSLLLAAKTSGSRVTVSYNDVGNCEPWDANPNAYRKITRLK